jgi:hypothetical protein
MMDGTGQGRRRLEPEGSHGAKMGFLIGELFGGAFFRALLSTSHFLTRLFDIEPSF